MHKSKSTTMDKEIKSFVEKIGAKAPGRDWKLIFPRARDNYFILEHFIIIKISRRGNTFWGLTKKYVDKLNDRENYFLVLLDSDTSGWFFNKVGINKKIGEGEWNLQVPTDQYKINYNTIKYEGKRFTSPNQFLEMAGLL